MYWLATDLDGTFIPLETNKTEHRDALKLLGDCAQTEDDRAIVFVTGRHLESVLSAIESEQLPVPHSIVCDVGSSLWINENGKWIRSSAYLQTLNKIVGDISPDVLISHLDEIAGLVKQEAEKQGTHKLSFYCDASKVEDISKQVEEVLNTSGLPYSIISSVDPFNGDGLIDLLPKGVNKLFAVKWFQQQNSGGSDSDSLIFSGDSGNDLEVFLSDIRSVVVANTPEAVKARIKRAVSEGLSQETVFFANKASTSGVLEGAAHWGWLKTSGSKAG